MLPNYEILLFRNFKLRAASKQLNFLYVTIVIVMEYNQANIIEKLTENVIVRAAEN